jgi:hypothetical protein
MSWISMDELKARFPVGTYVRIIKDDSYSNIKLASWNPGNGYIVTGYERAWHPERCHKPPDNEPDYGHELRLHTIDPDAFFCGAIVDHEHVRLLEESEWKPLVAVVEERKRRWEIRQAERRQFEQDAIDGIVVAAVNEGEAYRYRNARRAYDLAFTTIRACKEADEDSDIHEWVNVVACRMKAIVKEIAATWKEWDKAANADKSALPA